jgi:recombination protein RecT
MSTDLVSVVHEQRERFDVVRVDKTMEFEREAGFALQIMQASDYLMTVARENPDSLRNAVTNVAAFGVTLNPAQKFAYLVPRKVGGKRAICLDVSYMGLMYVAQSCGAILWGQAVVVREKDTFELQGLDQQPIHKYAPFSADRGNIIGVYCVVKTAGGDYLTHPMKLSDVHAIRDRSDAWKAYKRDSTKTCPWVTDEVEMIKKTCVKQASKYWPKHERLDQAIHHLNTDGGEGISLTPNKLPDEEYEKFKAAIQNADTKEAAKVEWKKAFAVCQDLGDSASAERLKEVLLAHAKVLDEAAAGDQRAAA